MIQPVFFCKGKFQKGSKLTQAVQLRAYQTLCKSAIRKGDEKILAVTSRDIAAAETHYHISCYKNCTRDSTKTAENKAKGNEEKKTGGADPYQVIESEAFTNLFKFIRTDVIPNKKVVPMTFLTSKLESFMLSGVIGRLTDSTRKHICRRQESELGRSIGVFVDDKGTFLVVPENVLLKDVVLENQSKSTDVNTMIDQTCTLI